jgi:hypothetical protein
MSIESAHEMACLAPTLLVVWTRLETSVELSHDMACLEAALLKEMEKTPSACAP